jgi:hypothetical protein
MLTRVRGKFVKNSFGKKSDRRRRELKAKQFDSCNSCFSRSHDLWRAFQAAS